MEAWPENEAALHLFRALGTQWRIGVSGPTGLDHNVLLARLDRMQLTDAEREQLDADVRVMEHQALETISDERDKREQQTSRK